MEYADMLHRCFRCGWCKLPVNFSDINCPAYLNNRFESFMAGGRLWLLRAWLNKEIKTSDRFLEVMYSCATCKNCVESCGIPGIKDLIVDMIIEGREEVVNRGVIPPAVKDYFQNVYNWGNPYKKQKSARGRWADGLGVPGYDGQEHLFYAGDEGSFDEAGIEMARSVAGLLLKAGVSFGILGEEETCDGNEVSVLGERGLFQHLAEGNIAAFHKRGVKSVITLSPHSFNAMKNLYPQYNGRFAVQHYTQALAGAARKLPLGKFSPVVTYHDPCYLGRWNNEYWAARVALRAIPDARVVEMDRSMGNALCCGGGGGNFYTDMAGSGDMSAGRARVREALGTGAEVLAVACPICFKMLDDAVKDEGAEGKIRVMDVSQVLSEAMG